MSKPEGIGCMIMLMVGCRKLTQEAALLFAKMDQDAGTGPTKCSIATIMGEDAAAGQQRILDSKPAEGRLIVHGVRPDDVSAWDHCKPLIVAIRAEGTPPAMESPHFHVELSEDAAERESTVLTLWNMLVHATLLNQQGVFDDM